MAMTEPTTTAPRCYTPEGLADRWKCSPSHVRKLINSGDLRAWKLGGKLLRIRPEDVEAFPPPASELSAEDHVASLAAEMRRRRMRKALTLQVSD